MIILSFTPPPLLTTKLPHLLLHHPHLKPQTPNQTRKRRFKCKAEFSQDAPFAVAIGASVLNSLVFPLPKSPNDDGDGDGDGDGIDATDARFAVMGIISFIPYFNWLSWIFAWLDTRSPRYAFYALVYLAPYIRTNLSLSPEESWLPITSIILCIVHIQLEASIRNGDLQSFQLFKGADANRKAHKRISKEESKAEKEKLPSAEEHSRDELHGWGVPEKPLDKQLEEGKESDEH